jgi:integrase
MITASLFVNSLCFFDRRVCRLKVGDLDINDKKLYVRAKKTVKIKTERSKLRFTRFITLIRHFLFTPKMEADGLQRKITVGQLLETFKTNVKDHFNLSADYGMYSFRHTFITSYRELHKSYSLLKLN